MNLFKFLIDVNLPQKFSFFNSPDFTHVTNINPEMSDSDIWDYALQHGFATVTKDSDFYHKSMTSIQSPKIVYLKLGNQTLKQLHQFFEQNWELIISTLPTARLLLVEKESITVIIGELTS